MMATAPTSMPAAMHASVPVAVMEFYAKTSNPVPLVTKPVTMRTMSPPMPVPTTAFLHDVETAFYELILRLVRWGLKPATMAMTATRICARMIALQRAVETAFSRPVKPAMMAIRTKRMPV